MHQRTQLGHWAANAGEPAEGEMMENTRRTMQSGKIGSLGKPLRRLAVVATIAIAATACGNIENVREAISGDYHQLSPATLGVYLTIKRHATDGMVAHFLTCRNKGGSDSACGTKTLRRARATIVPKLLGDALRAWNGEYPAFGYSPHIGSCFRDEEGMDFATAVRDLAERNHQCLRVHWKSSGTNWTTVQDAGVAECGWGEKLK
jgi:hypothetical protein